MGVNASPCDRSICYDPRVPPFPVEVRFPLQWGEMDALGHANNACYFRWFEAARI